MYQRKLNICHPIYAIYVSIASVFNFVGVTSDDTEEVDYLRCLTPLMSYFRDMGWTLYGRERVMEDR